MEQIKSIHHIMFRVDASIEIGTGHVMRCLTLAENLQCQKAEITFICRNLVGNLIEFIKDKGFTVKILPPFEDDENTFDFKEKDFQFNTFNWELDARQTKEIVKNKSVDWLVIDHYMLENNWHKVQRPYVKKIMVIDDLANRKHNCDVILDQNFYLNLDKRYNGLLPNQCLLLLGPQYAILRKEFIDAKKRLQNRSGRIKRILITFGGSDPTNETLKVLKALENINIGNVLVDVVVGSTNPNKHEIIQYCKTKKNYSFYCQVNNMAELMMNADLLIGSGGTTTWERCFLGLPSLTIITAENQVEVTQAVEQVGATYNLGISHSVSPNQISEQIVKFLNDPEILKELSQKALSIMGEIKKDEVINTILGVT